MNKRPPDFTWAALCAIETGHASAHQMSLHVSRSEGGQDCLINRQLVQKLIHASSVIFLNG